MIGFILIIFLAGFIFIAYLKKSNDSSNNKSNGTISSNTSNYDNNRTQLNHASNTQKAKEAIIETVNSFCREKFTKEEFERGKEQITSSLIFSQESTVSQMLLYGKHMLYNNVALDLKERVRSLEEMTMEDCERALELNFRAEDMASAVVGKVKKPLSF